MKPHRQAGTILTLSAILFSGHVIAAPWVIGSDMNDGVDWSNNLSYSGVYQNNTGTVSDGGHDGFDGFGYLSNSSGVSVYRQADVLQDINVYRWVDTYTNNGSTQYSNTVRFHGNLGSDGGTVLDSTSAFSSVSHESWAGNSYDPVFGIVWGNNSWTVDNVTHSRSGDNVYNNILLDLAIGESISIAHFVTLARPDDENYYTDSYGGCGVAVVTTQPTPSTTLRFGQIT